MKEEVADVFLLRGDSHTEVSDELLAIFDGK